MIADADDWRESAVCADSDEDSDTWHLDDTKGAIAAAATALAKELCADCPVRPECLAYALQIGPVTGVWGGTTEAERRILMHSQPVPRERLHVSSLSGGRHER